MPSQWSMRSPVTLCDAIRRSNQAVRCHEDRGVLHAQPNQVVDIEESAVVDLLRGGAPGGQPVGLGVKQQVQAVEAVRVPFDAIDGCQRCLYHWL